MKKCCLCKQEKEYSEFNRKSCTKDGYQNKCRECSKLKSKEYYRKNHDYHIQQISLRKKRYIKIFTEYVNNLKSKGCSICPEKEICCIDFHHIDPSKKDANISYLLKTLNKDRLDEEISKCVLLCSNCHRKLHAGIIKLTPLESNQQRASAHTRLTVVPNYQ